MIDKLLIFQQALARIQGTQKPSAAAAQGELARASSAAPRRRPEDAMARRGRIEERLRQRIGAIRPDDPQRRQQALRALIEVSLLTEFGDALGNDPAFHALVDKVTQTMEEDAALQPAIDEALQPLLS